MTVEDFLLWAGKHQESQRYELINGQPVAMAPERARHAIAKGEMFIALHRAVKSKGVSCIVFPDGMTVKVDEFTAYEPDAVVSCDKDIGGDDLIVINPVIIVEILSPGTQYVDLGTKLSGYFQLDSVRHYLILDPVRKNVIHHERSEKGVITTHIIRDGDITMSPPGIKVALQELFGQT